MKHEYFASWTANNGSVYGDFTTRFASKREAAQWARACARGNHFPQVGNTSTYEVRDENGRVVAAGALLGRGRWCVFTEAIEA